MLRYLRMEIQENSCIYLLYKKESLWTESQRVRAGILFREYPDIKKAYYFSMRLGLIYHQCRHKDVALTRLARWYDEVDKSGFLVFGRVARSIQTHYLEIINYFERRSTNAASESFNANIKNFRSQFRGVTLSKILCKWKQDSVVSLFLYLDSVFKNKHKLVHNQAPV